ncbi:hypothetical protein [Streptomyces pseudogriseolus]
MGLGDIRYEHVIAATEEFRRLGREEFLRTYGSPEAPETRPRAATSR